MSRRRQKGFSRRNHPYGEKLIQTDRPSFVAPNEQFEFYERNHFSCSKPDCFSGKSLPSPKREKSTRHYLQQFLSPSISSFPWSSMWRIPGAAIAMIVQNDTLRFVLECRFFPSAVHSARNRKAFPATFKMTSQCLCTCAVGFIVWRYLSDNA